MWVVYALLSAFFASLTAIFAKIGMKNVDSDLATAIRTLVILVIAWGIVFFKNGFSEVTRLTRHNLLFLLLSGVATGLSWIFYFRALKNGHASQVAPVDKLSVAITIALSVILLKEVLTLKLLVGACLVIAGTLVIIL